MSKPKRKLRFLWILGYVVVLVVAFFVIKPDPSQGTTMSETYKQQIRNALAEISFPSNNNLNQISAASDDLSEFMNYRAGVQLSQSNKNSLNSLEQSFWSDSKRIGVHGLAEVMTEIAVERIPQLTDTEINGITEAFKGFNAPGLPVGFVASRNYIHLRGRVVQSMSASSFTTELTNLRNGGVESKIAQNMIKLAVTQEIERKTKLITEAEPTFFGNTEANMTPLQAVLISYLIATDDEMAYNQTGLTNRMNLKHQSLAQRNGSYPSPSGHKAYGTNGYLFSSPSSMALNESNFNLLINKIQQKGVVQ